MANIGRKIKLTPRLERKIIMYTKEGNSTKTVCQCVGIDESTYYRWMERAKKGEEPFASFASRLTRAKAIGEFNLIKQIIKATQKPKKWQAAAWLLERMYPVRYARKIYKL